MDRQAYLGKRFTLKHDTTFYGGREQVDGMIRAGTEVEVVCVGHSQLNVEVVDFPLGHLSFWVHGISLQERVSDPMMPLRLVNEQREGQATENATVSGGNEPFTPPTPPYDPEALRRAERLRRAEVALAKAKQDLPVWASPQEIEDRALKMMRQEDPPPPQLSSPPKALSILKSRPC